TASWSQEQFKPTGSSTTDRTLWAAHAPARPTACTAAAPSVGLAACVRHTNNPLANRAGWFQHRSKQNRNMCQHTATVCNTAPAVRVPAERLGVIREKFVHIRRSKGASGG